MTGICVFTITDDRITDNIIDAHGRGVQVRVISDNDKAHDRGSDLSRLRRHGLPVAFDKTPDHMHHKFAVFDSKLLVSGSYNWTRSAADRNEEIHRQEKGSGEEEDRRKETNREEKSDKEESCSEKASKEEGDCEVGT